MSKDYLDSWEGFEEHRVGGMNRMDALTGGHEVVPFNGKAKKAKKASTMPHGDAGKRCYPSHPALKLPGTELVIYGGSCLHPVVTDADVYIGFDDGMRFTARQWPWRKGHEVLFAIRDMDAPKNPKDFIALVGWTREQLEAGQKVHCGCMGGHGRTGLFLAALCSHFGEKDAITYVRKHYCDKAVESSAQMKFLQEHFGVLEAKGSKSLYSSGKSSGLDKSGGNYHCVSSPACIWGEGH